MLPSASASTQQRERGEGRDAGSSGTAQEEEEEEEEAGRPSLCTQINRIPEHRCHMTAPRGGWGLHSADPAE